MIDGYNWLRIMPADFSISGIEPLVCNLMDLDS